MKKLLLSLAVGLIFGSVQAQELPQPSPHCKIEQKVGLTDITLDYSRPGVKGRTVFGELVPYDKVWRFGANKNTMVTFSTDAKIAGKDLKAGTYSVFATPSKGEWTIAFNSNIEQWGEGEYTTEKDVLSVKVKASEHHMHETFTIEINTITNNSGVIAMVWEKVKVEIPFTVDTDANAKNNIEEALKKGEDLDKVNYAAARYYHSSKKDSKTAMEYCDKSLKIKETHRAMYLKAQILNADGKKDDAIKTAMKAKELATKAESKGWADYIQENIDKWKK
jgi:hypothetical protein